jgi:hypothetical protein
MRYVYGRSFDHISKFSRGILGCKLVEYLKLRLAGLIHNIVIFGVPDCLSSLLVLGRSPRHRFLVMLNPQPVTSLRHFIYSPSNIQLVWVPGLLGNENADAEATKAAA